MNDLHKTLIILTPAFTEKETDVWLPSQANFVRALNKKYPELEVIILTFHYPFIRNKMYNWFGNKVISFNGEMKGGIHSIVLWIKVWRFLNRIKKTKKLLGLFSFFCSECAFIGHYFAKKNKLKHFIWLLGQDAKKENRQVKRIRPEAGELIAISDFLVREFYQNHGIKPAHVIPIGIDSDNYIFNPAERVTDLIGAGSLSPIKQYDLFIAVVKEINRQIPGISAVICGEGSERQKLQEQISDLQLDGVLCLTGTKSNHSLLRMMQQSKILLHTSSYEGFGMVCTEALFAGAHVISFCKPMDATIENWHTVSNKEEMIEKAVGLLKNESRYHASILPFPMERTVTELMQLFHYPERS